MSTFGLSFVGKFVLFRSVLYQRFHCILLFIFDCKMILKIIFNGVNDPPLGVVDLMLVCLVF